MRLPADAALIVIDVQEAIDDPCWGPRNNLGAEVNIAALIAAWRAERLPIIHVRHDSVEPGSPYAPGAPGHRFKACAMPLDGEPVVGKTANSAFVGAALEGLLDGLGATTLVICGVLTSSSVETTARHAGNLGYQTFVVADACWTVDKVDLQGRRWPAEDVHALSLAHLNGEYATVVDTRTTLEAAAMARARQRWKEGRSRGQV
ncbi:MAG: cysteine hydrolase [Hyphomicrobiales bacterium]|nr:cysteine hydrolase [Hyphomicrobiales bacterium]MBV8440455.1 cysteine hydrolase [Hyphomicrobiales bacterium]